MLRSPCVLLNMRSPLSLSLASAKRFKQPIYVSATIPGGAEAQLQSAIEKQLSERVAAALEEASAAE